MPPSLSQQLRSLGRRIGAWAWLAAALASGCALSHPPAAQSGREEDVAPTDDALATDSGEPEDAGVDVPGDTGRPMDTGARDVPLPPMDTGVRDVPVALDTRPDTGVDTGIDTGTDTGTDTGVDTGIDTGVDTGVTEVDVPTVPDVPVSRRCSLGLEFIQETCQGMENCCTSLLGAPAGCGCSRPGIGCVPRGTFGCPTRRP